MKIAVINGPNLNLLGRREPAVYGTASLEDVEARSRAAAGDLGIDLVTFQANGEGELIDRIHALGDEVAGFVVNAGAYTHTSIAIRDALVGVGRPFVEVHLTNVHAREPFRYHSYLAPVALGVIGGFGVESYVLALRALVVHLQDGGRTTAR